MWAYSLRTLLPPRLIAQIGATRSKARSAGHSQQGLGEDGFLMDPLSAFIDYLNG